MQRACAIITAVGIVTVYVDVLIFINTVLDYAVLVTAQKLLKRDVRLWRLLLGAFAGALFALTIFIGKGGTLLPLLIRILSSAAVTMIAFGFHSGKEYLKATAVTLAASAFYCGVMILFYQLVRPPNMLIYNDIVYLQVDPLLLLLLTGVIYVLLLLLHKLFFERIKNTVVSLRFTVDDREFSCIGKIDTGCNVVEPFSSSPVIIADNSVFTVAEDSVRRVIPYTTLTGSSLLYAVKADSVTINKKPIAKSVYIASADVNDRNFQAIINSEIVR